MKQLEIEYIVTQGKLPESIVRALLDGVGQTDLEALLSREYGLPPNSSQLSIARMNTIGGLRAMGYDVTGGRKGRNQPYKIVGWAEKQAKSSYDTWTGRSRNVVEWVHRQPKCDDKQYDLLRQHLSTRAEAWHEMSPLYVLCYELARDTGYMYQTDSGLAVICQKNVWRPYFRVFNVNMSVDDLLELARYLADGSIKSPYIVNCSAEHASEFRKLDPQGSWGRRRQTVFRTREIAEHPERFLNKRGLEMLRANSRQLSYDETATLHDCEHVIKTWKASQQDKHRQLAITRDFVSVRCDTPKWTFLGRRNEQPACLHVLDRLANRSNFAACITEKSLNYRSQENGKPGTADWNMYATCVELVQQGIEFVNYGGIDGGGVGLPDHKRRWCREEDDQVSLTYYTSYVPGAPE